MSFGDCKFANRDRTAMGEHQGPRSSYQFQEVSPLGGGRKKHKHVKINVNSPNLFVSQREISAPTKLVGESNGGQTEVV